MNCLYCQRRKSNRKKIAVNQEVTTPEMLQQLKEKDQGNKD